jgi:hypothetical protein
VLSDHFYRVWSKSDLQFGSFIDPWLSSIYQQHRHRLLDRYVKAGFFGLFHNFIGC